MTTLVDNKTAHCGERREKKEDIYLKSLIRWRERLQLKIYEYVNYVALGIIQKKASPISAVPVCFFVAADIYI